jgi:DNA-binding transcriptional ArsR family regulator
MKHVLTLDLWGRRQGLHRNGQTLFEICARLATTHVLGSSRQAISQHRDVLEAAAQVEPRREGRHMFQYINTTPLGYINTTPLGPIVERWLKKAGKDGGPVAPGAGTRGRDQHEDKPDQRAR